MEHQDPITRITALNARPASRRWRLMAVLILFVVGGGILRNALGIEWSTEGIRTLVSDAGVWAPIIFVSLLVFRILLVIPSVILLPAGGLFFGVVEGSIYGAIGLTLSGLLNFGLVRWAGPQAFRNRISPRFQGILEIARSKAGAGAVAVISAYPFGPITITHLGAAIAGMSFFVYLVAVTIGSLVRSATFSLFGASLVESDRLGWASLAMAGAFIIPLLFPRSRAWLRQSFGRAPAENGES
jgi:uncharacterized membrane protein YdjX (TVP38/TMEM64 family)